SIEFLTGDLKRNGLPAIYGPTTSHPGLAPESRQPDPHHIRYVLPRYLKSEKKLKRSPTTEGKCGDIGFDATIYGGGPVEEAAAVRTETVAFPRLT
ncbi:hypothetical protein HID58_032965, partial [Brassica napus]